MDGVSVRRGGPICLSVRGEGSRKNLDLKLTLTIFLRKNICESHKKSDFKKSVNDINNIRINESCFV